MQIKHALISSFMAGLVLPLTAMAGGDLTITNNTNFDVTSMINGNVCSQKVLGDGGITHPHTTNIITALKVKLACGLHQTDCQAALHLSNDCSGPTIAMVSFDTNTGIKSVQVIDSNYSLNGNGFTAILDGGPALTDSKAS